MNDDVFPTIIIAVFSTNRKWRRGKFYCELSDFTIEVAQRRKFELNWKLIETFSPSLDWALHHVKKSLSDDATVDDKSEIFPKLKLLTLRRLSDSSLQWQRSFITGTEYRNSISLNGLRYPKKKILQALLQPMVCPVDINSSCFG